MDVSNAQRNSILHALPQPQTTTRHGTWYQGYVELGHQRYVQYNRAFFYIANARICYVEAVSH